jgi:hypothetical protein
MPPMPGLAWGAVRGAVTGIGCVLGFAVVGCALDLGGTGAVPAGDGGPSASGESDGAGPNLPTPDATGLPLIDAALTHDANPPVAIDAGGDAGRDAAGDGEVDAGLDAGVGAAVDARADAAVDAGIDAEVCTNGDPSCIVVPPGWSLVAFTATPTRQCPGGFVQTSTVVFEGPNLDSACTCGRCSVTANPTCENGAVQILSSPSFPPMGPPQCSANPVSELANDPAGACLPYPFSQGGPGNPMSNTGYVPPAVSGGACTAPGETQPGAVTFASVESLCSADGAQSDACDGKPCTPKVDSPYAACIMMAGPPVPCPPNSLFTTAHAIATAVGFSCTDCGCTIAAECSGGLQLFSDGACQAPQGTVPVNGNCNAFGGPGGGASYRYAASPPANVTCAAQGMSMASDISLIATATVCCAP